MEFSTAGYERMRETHLEYKARVQDIAKMLFGDEGFDVEFEETSIVVNWEEYYRSNTYPESAIFPLEWLWLNADTIKSEHAALVESEKTEAERKKKNEAALEKARKAKAEKAEYERLKEKYSR